MPTSVHSSDHDATRRHRPAGPILAWRLLRTRPNSSSRVAHAARCVVTKTDSTGPAVGQTATSRPLRIASGGDSPRYAAGKQSPNRSWASSGPPHFAHISVRGETGGGSVRGAAGWEL
jgi:hypothetical protein